MQSVPSLQLSIAGQLGKLDDRQLRLTLSQMLTVEPVRELIIRELPSRISLLSTLGPEWKASIEQLLPLLGAVNIDQLRYQRGVSTAEDLLVDAAARNDLETVLSLAADKPVNEWALLAAAEQGHFPLLVALTMDNPFLSRLALAALGGGHRHIFDWFQARGAVINPGDVLAAAAMSGDLQLVRDSIERIQHDSLSSIYVDNALANAINNQHWEIVNELKHLDNYAYQQWMHKLLISKLEQAVAPGKSSELEDAIRLTNVYIAELRTTQTIHPGELERKLNYAKYALAVSNMQSLPLEARQMLEELAPQFLRPLVKLDRLELVKLALTQGAVPDASVVAAAIDLGNNDMTELLLANLTDEQLPPLLEQLMALDRTDLVERALRQGGLSHLQYDILLSTLHSDNTEMLELLLSRTGKGGFSMPDTVLVNMLLLKALSSGYPEAAALLIEWLSAQEYVRIPYGHLLGAVKSGSPEVVQLVLDNFRIERQELAGSIDFAREHGFHQVSELLSSIRLTD